MPAPELLSRQQRITATTLTYVGTLPLVAAALGLIPGDGAFVATTYSAIILSFLAGIHWACALFFATHCPRNLLLTSNIVALLAWLSLLAAHSPWQILLQILCFTYLLLLDNKLREAGILPAWFFTLRRNATVIVVLSLTIIMGRI